MMVIDLVEKLDINYNAYGCWINSKTKQVLKVGYQNHSGIMRNYMNENGIDVGMLATPWAIKNGWIRVTFNYEEINLHGENTSFHSLWNELYPILKSYQFIIVDIFTSDSDHYFKEFSLPNDLQELRNFKKELL